MARGGAGEGHGTQREETTMASEPATRPSASAARGKRWRARRKRDDPTYLAREAARQREHRRRQAEARVRPPVAATDGPREPWEAAD